MNDSGDSDVECIAIKPSQHGDLRQYKGRNTTYETLDKCEGLADRILAQNKRDITNKLAQGLGQMLGGEESKKG